MLQDSQEDGIISGCDVIEKRRVLKIKQVTSVGEQANRRAMEVHSAIKREVKPMPEAKYADEDNQSPREMNPIETKLTGSCEVSNHIIRGATRRRNDLSIRKSILQAT